jgi:hypothetical protein
MKKAKQKGKDELRAEYKRSDFSGSLVRGKYSKRLRESSNIVVLRPEVAEAFPNEEAVNTALLSLINLAQKTSRRARNGSERLKVPSV